MNQDFRDLFRIFNEEQVEYLVAGAHAVIFYTEPRYTKDLDIWVNASPANAERVYRALARFGAPMDGVTAEDFCDKTLIYQVGVEPNRIDFLMGDLGASFSEAWADRQESTYAGVPIHIMGRRDLVKAKLAVGRPQDLLDVERLNLDSEEGG